MRASGLLLLSSSSNLHLSIRPTPIHSDIVVSNIRRIYPVLFATWILAHSAAALFIFGRWTALGTPGSEGVQAIAWAFERICRAFGEIFWLPKSVWVTLLFGWILILFVGLGVTAAVRLFAIKTGTSNELQRSLDAVTWAATAPAMFATTLTAAGLTFVMAQTDWFWLLPIPLFASYCLATHEPMIRTNGIWFDWRLFKARVPSLLLAVAGYACMLGISAGVMLIDNRFYWPIPTILDAVLYVAGLVIGGVLLSTSLYGFSAVRMSTDFRRFRARR